MSHPSKCPHDVYWPANDPVNLGCQQCNPDGLGNDGSVPILPRSSGDTLGRRDDKRECCPCGNVRTYSGPNCRACNKPFPESDLRGRAMAAANQLQAGTCPQCGSAVHFETKKKNTWQCADCNTEYNAPKHVVGEDPDED